MKPAPAKPECPICQQPGMKRKHTSEELKDFHPGSNPDCPACQEFRLHTSGERMQFHYRQELKP